MKPALALVPALALGACANLVPTTVARLAALSPLNADPEGFEVALDLPDGAGVMPGSAVLTIEASRSGTGEGFEESYVLEGVPGDPPVWRIARADLPALRAAQARALAWEMEDPIASSGALGVFLVPCREGDGPGQDAVLSILLRSEVGGPFRPLVRDARIADFAGEDDLAALPDCP